MAAVTSVRSRWLWLVLVVGAGAVAVLLVPNPLWKRPIPNDLPLVATPSGGVEISTSDLQVHENATALADRPHPLDNLLKPAYEAREALKAIQDYAAVFSRREQISRRLVSTKMNLKVRVAPFSVYLKFVEPKSVAGRQVVFIKGSNNDNLLVQEAGFKSILGIQPLPPTGSLAMADSRYPVTMIGLQKMIDLIIAQWESERAYDDITTRVEADAKLPTGEVCTVYESIVPTPRDKVQFHITRLWIDQKTQLAIRVEQLGWPQPGDINPPVLEDYTYSNIRTNVGLSEVDFDAKRAFQP